MKKLLTRLSFALFFFGAAPLLAQAPVPELLHYKFDGTGTSVPNQASTPPAGTTTATIMGGITQGPTGQCGGALIGSGNSASTDYLNTGYTTNLSGSWTISMYTADITSSTILFYIFGDNTAGSFRCFTNGVAGANNWILRGPITDVLVTGGATVAPHVTTFVYDATAGNIMAYLDGNLVNTVAQAPFTVSGTGPFKVMGYGTNVGAPAGGKLDEFRLYNRALSAAEVQSLMIVNTSSTISPISCTSTYTAPSGATYTTAGTYMDTIANASGCDSVITINLSFSTPASSSFSVTTCDSYTAPSGAVFTSSGTYMDTISTVSGCDSVLTISLTVDMSSTAAISPTACDMYTAPSGAMYMSSGTYMDTIANAMGCDSVITINLTINPSSSNSVTVTACDSYTAPSGAVLTASGTFYDTIPNMAGCDSITTINLTINSSSATTLNEVVCTSYTAPSGAVYTTSGVYMDTIANMMGCDSVITINLSVNQSYATMNVMACDTFTAPSGAMYFASGTYMDTITNVAGCDSVMTINLTLNATSSSTISATACNMYVAPSGAVYTSSGTYTDNIPNAMGCDSVITINLVVNTVNANATQNGATLTASATGATYQWIDCSNNSAISGATAQSYTATANGSYAVVVTQNSCTDTSACMNVTGIGIAENGFGSQLRVYPNPSKGDFFIDLGTTYSDITVVITDIAGRTVLAQAVNSGNIVPVALNEPAGVYIITVTAENKTAVIKLVKE